MENDPWITKRCLLRIFFPLGWAVVCLIAFIVYLAVPSEPRTVASVAWLVSFTVSIIISKHILKYHRNTKRAHMLPELNQKRVKIKFIISFIFTLILFATAIIFWIQGNAHSYADACAYSVAFILSAIWSFDLWFFHRFIPRSHNFKESEIKPLGQKTDTDEENDNTNINENN